MAPGKLEKIRAATVITPVVRSDDAVSRLASSLRRLGADEKTVATVTGQRQQG